MPIVTGLDLGHEIRAMPNFRNTKLILATSEASAKLRREVLNAGFTAAVTKPVRQNALLERIREVLTGDVEPAAARLQSAAPTAPFDLRVLVVDDSVTNQLVAVAFLERLGIHADVAGDGAEALEMVKRGQYHLVLMDIHMPVTDGYTATKMIRALEGENSAITIVAMTANAMEGDRKACLAAGMDDYLSKPIDYKHLVELVARCGEKFATPS
jgi:CheY-like chemotaxis protein